MHDDAWDLDLISKSDDGIIAKISYDSYLQLKISQPATAVRFYNRIIRHMSYELIYDRKNNAEYYDDHMEKQIQGLGLSDEDFVIDLKLGTKEAIHNMYRANNYNKIMITDDRL